MPKSKEEYIIFIHQAMADRNSPAFKELYQFLVGCFTRADKNKCGKITLDQFDSLVEDAAATPRSFGFAPKTEVVYPTDAQRVAARTKMFNEMDTGKHGYITLQEWIKYTTTHIKGKVGNLGKNFLDHHASDVTKDEFLSFIKKAANKGTPEYQELYFFLLKCFTKFDVNRVGAIDVYAFDKMIEDAAAQPRRFGLAPKSADIYKTDDERISKRKDLMKTMDHDENGLISFHAWFDYAFKHIVGKAAKL